MKEEDFHTRLRRLIIEYILLAYKILQKFPKDEIYGMTSQCKRALVSIFLNYVEGYSRISKGVTRNSYEISYGSLQESIGVFFLATQLNFIAKEEYLPLFICKEEIGKMLWKTIQGVKKDEEYNKK
ncbi:four helix bundle protein [Patescibacteria group bacterium]|nr:four helix bundle protein [Patescibacteria group bacterium]